MLKWSPGGDWPVALLLALLAVASVLWLYPGPLRQTSGLWRWGLPGLRLVALLVLAASLLRPVVTRPRSDDEGGAVIVLLDQSRSMSVSDRGRSPAEKVALADGLGLLPAGTRSDVSQAMRRDLDRLLGLVEEVMRAQRELEFARVSGQGMEQAERRLNGVVEQFQLLATRLASQSQAGPRSAAATLAELGKLADPRASGLGPAAQGSPLRPLAERERWATQARNRIGAAANMANTIQATADDLLYRRNDQIKRQCDDLADRSRWELVQWALLGIPGNESGAARSTGILAALPPSTLLFGFTFDDQLQAVALSRPGQTPNHLDAEPLGLRTDVVRSVPEALARVKGRSIRAVFLFSDGRQTVGSTGAEPASIAVASGLGASAVPVLAVAAAPERAEPDLSFDPPACPTSAFVGETLTLRANLRQQGLKGSTVTVRLSDGADEQTRQLTLSDAQLIPLEFSLKLTQAGTRKLSLSVDGVPGEISTENNRAECWVKVLAAKMKIAMYAGWPSWDYQYVREALSRPAWAALQALVLSPQQRLPLSPAEILQLDLLILHDVDVSALSDGQWDAVVQLVKERGGGLILVAGGQQTPRDYAEHLLLKDLLPFRGEVMPVWRTWPGQEPFFHLIPTPESEDLPVLKLDGQPTKLPVAMPGSGQPAQDTPAAMATSGPRSAQGWSGLPGIYHYLSIPQLKPNVTRVLLMERDSGNPVLTESRLGAGRVFFLGTNETWRWRRAGGTASATGGTASAAAPEGQQDRFWQQLARYAAEAPYAATSGGASLDVNQVWVEVGDEVQVRARVMQAEGIPSPLVQQTLKIIRDNKTVRAESLTTSLPGSGRYSGTISGLEAGDYILELAAGEGQPPARLSLQVGRSDQRELADLSPDYSTLRKLAAVSGGELLTLEQVNQLPQRLSDLARREDGLVEYRLWDSYYLFLFVLACLGAEWALRKRLGLA